MSATQELQYSRAMNLSDAITEQFLFEQTPQLAGPLPIHAPSWEAHCEELGAVLLAFAWAIMPTDDNKPDANVLNQVPMGLVLTFRSHYNEKARTVLLDQINSAVEQLLTEYTFGQHRELMTLIERVARDEANSVHESPR